MLASMWLMLNLQAATWARFGVWMAVALILYFTTRRGTAGAPKAALWARARVKRVSELRRLQPLKAPRRTARR